ncbi:MAG: tyrosine-type recombinase/integrase [Candidatus Bathyarchaeales archaeon]
MTGAEGEELLPQCHHETMESSQKRVKTEGSQAGSPCLPAQSPRQPQQQNASTTDMPMSFVEANPSCPECGSTRLYRDGLRYLADGEAVQRWLCRNCGFRFSENSKNELGYNRSCRVGASPYEGKAKNSAAKAVALAETTGKATSGQAGATETVQMDVKGLIVRFMAWLEKEGYGKESRYPNNLKTLVNLGANLLDPEDVKRVIGRHNIKNGAKLQYVYAYAAFLRMLKKSWDPPKYKMEESLPFIPDESELDALIAACRSRRMAAYLQCLKETFADPGEVLRLRWRDVSGNIITINSPVKGHLPRQIEVSNKLIAMLNSLPKTSERIFPTTYQVMFSCFEKVRKRAAELQKNPRILSIQLRSFRHWGGTIIAHYTNGNVLTVKRLLGHKRIENTMKYIGMINFKDDEFEVATATTDEEIKKLGAMGFVKYDERKIGETVVSYYRRPKRFSKYVS